ncbi:MAG: helix-turn-helix domain-containing protein [Terriglobia bacterium]
MDRSDAGIESFSLARCVTFHFKHSINWLSLSTHLSEESADDWISQAEAARLRGVSRQAIARLVQRGRLPVLKIGGRTLVRREDVERFEPESAGRPPK